MEKLFIGSNAELSNQKLTLTHGFSDSVDVSIFCLGSNGKVANDHDMVFYGMPNSPCGTIKLSSKYIEFDLNKVPTQIEKFAITATLDTNDSWQKIIDLNSSEFRCTIEGDNHTEKALILLEIYKRNDRWKVKFVGQGFNGGLEPLAEFFGVEIEKSPEPINLSKISLTKSNPKVDLTKRAGSLGLIKANLNWIKKSKGVFSSAIDLDLGAYIELNNGDRKIIQALGNSFEYYPYIKLLGDDRTGSNSDGEWLHIDGNKIQDIKRIIIFAFIYEGSANWKEADARITLHVPDMGLIETKLTETSRSKGFCAIAELTVNDGTVKVEQLNCLFKDHKECDKAFGWGFNWVNGSK